MTGEAYRGPVSAKGIVFIGGSVVLLRKADGALELPGGQVHLGETPEAAVVRELAEETGLIVTVHELVDATLYENVAPGQHTFLAIYGCLAVGGELRGSDEGSAILVPLAELDRGSIYLGYARAIDRWRRRSGLFL